MKRLVGAYLLMVGMPLLVILLVLHLGTELVAPATIDGGWAMHPASSEVSDSCSEAFPGVTSLVISQSGRHLSAQWKGRAPKSMSGTLDQNQFILCFHAGSTEQCTQDPSHLKGRIVDENGSRRIEVNLKPEWVAGCDELALHSEWRKIDSGRRTENN